MRIAILADFPLECFGQPRRTATGFAKLDRELATTSFA
jgi:hypothetical protein